MRRNPKRRMTRRSAVKKSFLAGAGGVAAGWSSREMGEMRAEASDRFKILWEKVEATSLVDTHEHLIEEDIRLEGKHRFIKSNDWSLLLSHYINSDLRTCGMPKDQYDLFFSPDVDPLRKWSILEPYWPRVRHTGYGQAVEIAVRKLYGVDGVSAATVEQIQAGYERSLRPGLYRRVLEEVCGIESCQVNSLACPFTESKQSTLLMQDISIVGMHMDAGAEDFSDPAGVNVEDLADWHTVIDWWFRKYGRYAVAVKSQAAYSRNIDYEDVSAEEVEGIFKRKINNDLLDPSEEKRLQDHLFWYAVRKATEHKLPVKLHTGYYAGENYMPLGRVNRNAEAASDLCRMAPETRFVFMHINYPGYEDIISVAKHYTNAYIDMCWAWIISPVASVNFLKEYLVTAPTNKVLTFGGDYIPVEPVVGHAVLARRGIGRALAGLVDDGWLDVESALGLVQPIMHGNARELFDLEEKTRRLRSAPWV